MGEEEKVASMWAEQWSVSKQRPFFLEVSSGKRAWRSPVDTVAESYDRVTRDSLRSSHGEDDGVRPRALAEVRFFHNQVKGVAIHMAMGDRPRVRALDVCCGKGGDLHKWMKSGRTVRLEGFDVSPSCVEEAERRSEEQGWNESTRFRVHDGRRAEAWGDPGSFDVVSCQFAVHYFFSSSKLASHFFSRCTEAAAGASSKLVLTYVDEDRLRAHLWGGDESLPDFCEVATVFEKPPPVGTPFPYTFHLDGSVLRLAEYSVPQAALFALLAHHGWVVEVDEPFVEFGRKHCMCVPSFEEGFVISRLYRVLIAGRKR